MHVNQIISGEISRVEKSHIIINLENHYSGFLHISEISDYYVKNMQYFFKKGESYLFLIKEIDEINKRIKLTWKEIYPRFIKNPFKYDIKNTESGFKNLINMTKEEVEKW